MSLEFLSWFTDLIKLIGDLIPRRLLIEPTHKALKFKGMTKPVELSCGRYWYVPFFTTVHLVPVVKQVTFCGAQTLLTKDNKVLRLETSVMYEIVDLKKAITEFYCFETQLDNDCRDIIAVAVNGTTYEAIVSDFTTLSKNLEVLLSKRLDTYGIKLLRLQFLTITSGVPLIHIGVAKAE